MEYFVAPLNKLTFHRDEVELNSNSKMKFADCAVGNDDISAVNGPSNVNTVNPLSVIFGDCKIYPLENFVPLADTTSNLKNEVGFSG